SPPAPPSPSAPPAPPAPSGQRGGSAASGTCSISSAPSSRSSAMTNTFAAPLPREEIERLKTLWEAFDKAGRDSFEYGEAWGAIDDFLFEGSTPRLPALLAEIEAGRAGGERVTLRPKMEWAENDQSLPEDDQIEAAHPVVSKHPDRYTVYAEAMRMV